MKVHLTEPQAGALECRYLDGDEAIIARCWDGGRTIFVASEDVDELLSALIDASNAEDAQYQETGDQFANRASRVLCNICDKVSKAAR